MVKKGSKAGSGENYAYGRLAVFHIKHLYSVKWPNGQLKLTSYRNSASTHSCYDHICQHAQFSLTVGKQYQQLNVKLALSCHLFKNKEHDDDDELIKLFLVCAVALTNSQFNSDDPTNSVKH